MSNVSNGTAWTSLMQVKELAVYETPIWVKFTIPASDGQLKLLL